MDDEKSTSAGGEVDPTQRKSRTPLSQHGRYDTTRLKWRKNVFNRVVHYQLARGILRWGKKGRGAKGWERKRKKERRERDQASIFLFLLPPFFFLFLSCSPRWIFSFSRSLLRRNDDPHGWSIDPRFPPRIYDRAGLRNRVARNVVVLGSFDRKFLRDWFQVIFDLSLLWFSLSR